MSKKIVIWDDTTKQIGASSSIGWDRIANKPSSYPPSSHTHTISDITDIADAHVSYADRCGDADTLDGLDSSKFLRSDVGGSVNGDLTIGGDLEPSSSGVYDIGSSNRWNVVRARRLSLVYSSSIGANPSNAGNGWLILASGSILMGIDNNEIAVSGSNLYLESTGDIVLVSDGGVFRPKTSGGVSLGSSSYKWQNLYVVNEYVGDIIFENGWRITEYDDDGNLFDGLRVLDKEGREVFSISPNGVYFNGNRIF